MRKFLVLGIIFIYHLNVHAQTNIDSLYVDLNQLHEQEKIDVLEKLALAYRTTSPDSVHKYAEATLNLALELNNSLGIAKSYRLLGLANGLVAKSDTALMYYQKALNLLPKGVNDKLEADINMGIGGELYYLSQLDTAVVMFINSATTYERLGQIKEAAPAYSNIGMILNANGQDERAKYYFHKALKIAEDNNLMGTKLPVLVNMGTLFLKRNENDSAIFYANKCYQISKTKKMDYGMARALIILSEAYSNEKQYNKGLATANEGIVLFGAIGNKKLLRSMQYKKAIAMKGLHKTAQALALAKQLLTEIEENESLRELLLFFIYEVNLELKNYQEALIYHKLYFEEYQKNEDKHHDDVVTELETKYETEKKSIEIQLLTDKAKIQELSIQKKNGLIIGTFLFFFITLLLIVLIYRQRSLKKQNEMLIIHQRLFRSQMNPHFIFNALTAIQKFVVNKDQLTGSGYIAKFAQLMRQVLEHSSEEFITVEDEIDALTNYLDLQQLRFDNSFIYEFKVSGINSLSNISIPPMLAQPFIENALEHGIYTKEQGKIDIHFTKNENVFSINILDNGKGLITEEAKNHKSRAIKITKERLQLFSKKDKQAYSIKVKNRVANKKVVGVEVAIILPFKEV